MQCKKACLVINPRAGQNIAKITDVLAVLAAAGWHTDIAIKEYGGHTLGLAKKAAEGKYDLVIGYGGDGTFNQVINGVMNADGKHPQVGVIPGGTANVWASEVDIPDDPVKAALTLVNSEARKVDIGHMEIEAISIPDLSDLDEESNTSSDTHKQEHRRKIKPISGGRNYFLLMAGLGIDAAIMGGVSKELKYKLGPLAVGVSAMKELPTQQPFPVEIRSAGGKHDDVVWKGEALQIVIGNTRKYGDIAEMTPDAYVDDGVLDVCVITAGDPLTTLQQLSSILLRRRPDNLTAEYFHGAHLSITVPASIKLQLDGSTVKLKDYLSKSDRKAIEHAIDAGHVMVTYRFDALPHALDVAIPNRYDDAIFEKGQHRSDENGPSEAQDQSDEQGQSHESLLSRYKAHRSAEEQQKVMEQVDVLLDKGRKVTVVGAAPDAAKKNTYIVAGITPKKSTGENKPVAVRIDEDTTIITRTGEHVPPAIARELREGGMIVVEGKQNKRGVIRAKHVVIV